MPLTLESLNHPEIISLIKKLKSKRQLSVQEQNTLLKHSILTEALYWRTNSIPSGLQVALKSEGVDTEKSIYFQYDQDLPGVCSDQGVVLTQNGEFYKFEVDLNKDRTQLIEFSRWENITSGTEIAEHKPGIGATWGLLALQVLAELNQYQRTLETSKRSN